MASADMTSTVSLLQRIYGTQNLSRQERALSCAILASRDSRGEYRSSLKELVRKSGYCDKTVSRILTCLEDKGLLRRGHTRFPDTPKRVTVFLLDFPDERPDTEKASAKTPSPKSDVLSDNGENPLSTRPGEAELLSPADGALSSTEPKDLAPQNLEPEDPDPQALDPEGQGQGQNPKPSGPLPHVPFPPRTSENAPSTPKSAPPAPTPPGKIEKFSVLPRKILELYRLLCSDLPPAGRLSAKRIRAVLRLVKNQPRAWTIDWWENYFGRAAASAFLCGSGPRGWRADLDWLLVPSNAAKVLSGNYDDRSPSLPRGDGESIEQFVDRMAAELRKGFSDDR